MADFSIVRLSPTADIHPFDCGNEDINDFLANDAVDYQDGFLAVTYLVMSEGNVLGYFCLLNDKLAYLPEGRGGVE
jgi:hypothetical protein